MNKKIRLFLNKLAYNFGPKKSEYILIGLGLILAIITTIFLISSIQDTNTVETRQPYTRNSQNLNTPSPTNSSPSASPTSSSAKKKTTNKSSSAQNSNANPSNSSTPSSESLSATVTFFGDTRTNHDIHQQVVNAILTKSGNPVFHVGDLVADGNNSSDWTTFNNITAALRASRSFYPAIGNHENDSQLYFDNFTLPNNERWYSVNTGNLHVIALDSAFSSTSPGSDQYTWLESDLQSSAAQSRIIAVIFHHPAYSSGGDSKGLQGTIVPLFRTYGVDLVLAGHEHNYQHLVADGIDYFVVGGGGAPLYDPGTTGYTIKTAKTYHYTVVNVYSTYLTLSVYDLNNTLIDQVTINK